ncbi:MAG: SDR family NAD(P)-dependent oxidoreductase [Bacteroidota bacterium]
MKKVLITGASDGIGLAAALLFAKQGDQLTLVARSASKLEAAVKSLPGIGHTFIVADLTTKDDVHKLKPVIEQERFDIVINNAGVGLYGKFHELTLSDQVKMMNLNMNALTAISHFYLGIATSGSTLVNIASTLGTSSFAGLSVYSATKAFVTIFSESLWREYKKKDIYVMAFCPGVTATHFHEGGGSSTEVYPKFITQTPEQVAVELVRAIDRRRKPRVVSGIMNRMMLYFQKFMSRRTVATTMGRFSPVKV